MEPMVNVIAPEAFFTNRSHGGRGHLYTVVDIMPSAVLTSLDVFSGKVLIDCNNCTLPKDNPGYRQDKA